MLRRIVWATLGMIGISMLVGFNLPLLPPEFGSITGQPIAELRRMGLYAVAVSLTMGGVVGVALNPPLFAPTGHDAQR